MTFYVLPTSFCYQNDIIIRPGFDVNTFLVLFVSVSFLLLNQNGEFALALMSLNSIRKLLVFKIKIFYENLLDFKLYYGPSYIRFRLW